MRCSPTWGTTHTSGECVSSESTGTGGRASKQVPKQPKQTKGNAVFHAGDTKTQWYVSTYSIIHALIVYNVSGCAGHTWKNPVEPSSSSRHGGRDWTRMRRRYVPSSTLSLQLLILHRQTYKDMAKNEVSTLQGPYGVADLYLN